MNNIITRRRIMNGIVDAILPKEYKALEYVNSAVTNPTCPIFSISVPFTVKLEVEPVNLAYNTQNYGCFFGANSNMQLAFNHSGNPMNGVSTNTSYTYVENKKVLVEGGFANNATLVSSIQYYKVDGLDLRLARRSNASSFAINAAAINATVVSYAAQSKYYSCKVFKDGECIIDLYPCKRKADGVNGLYDVVNDTFYGTNWLDS